MNTWVRVFMCVGHVSILMEGYHESSTFGFPNCGEVATWTIWTPKRHETPSSSRNKSLYHDLPKPWKIKGFGHLKTSLTYLKTSKNGRFWGAHGSHTLGLEPVCFVGGQRQNNRTRDNFKVMINDLAASALLFGILKDERVSKKMGWLEVCSKNLQKLISLGNYEFLGRLVKQITMKII